MLLFRLLKGRLDIIIIPVLLICISTICRINVIEPLKSTKMFLVGQLETPPDQRRWPKLWKGHLRNLECKNMVTDVLHHHQKGVLVLLATRRCGIWSNCHCNWNVSKSRQTFHETYTRVYLMV